MITNRKICVSCKRKKNLDNVKIVDTKLVKFCIYGCKDNKECLDYQIKNIKKK